MSIRLPVFGPADRVTATSYAVRMQEFQQQVLPASLYAPLSPPYNTGTYVWGYKVDGRPALYPGFTVEQQKGTQTTVRYFNELVQPDGSPPVLQKYLTVDQTLHWAAPLGLHCMGDDPPDECFEPYAGPVPAVTHLHGAEVISRFDGGPEQWFTPEIPGILTGLQGPAYDSAGAPVPGGARYRYPNQQEATTLWFHDHALGATRLNVYGGLAAFYLLRDEFDTGVPGTGLNLPAGDQEIEAAIQDRRFDTNGQWLFPDEGDNEEHPYWVPEFEGDVIVVNGKTWPYLNVEPKRYRLRLLNGSNARFYNLMFSDGRAFYQIGTDGGLLDEPALVRQLLIAPGERCDVIVDFAGLPAGAQLLLLNNARTPYPKGGTADPNTVGKIMQFRVVPLSTADTSYNPAAAGTLRGGVGQPPAMVRLADADAGTLAAGIVPDVVRQLTLNEVMGENGPLEALVNNSKWSGKSTDGQPIPDSQLLYGTPPMRDTWATELPRVGATELWEIVNLTGDAHPIHLHLVQFQIVNRQKFRTTSYMDAYEGAFPGGEYLPAYGPPFAYQSVNGDGAVGGNPAIGPHLFGRPVPPKANEAGWKDTAVMMPGEVTRIVVRYAPQNIPVGGVAPGINLFPFNPTVGPGYVWHCHIIDHEDNEMMRPYAVQP